MIVKSPMYQKYYSKFIESQKDNLHFTAHSHHFWPDVTLDAMIEYWNDSARLTDHKWEYILSEKVPQTQKLIAEILNLSHPENITFAPNTHELLFRLISSLSSKDTSKKIKILTTDSEFYSFERQIRRLQELPLYDIQVIPTKPFDSFESRFQQAVQSDQGQPWDMIFFSQVFFNSGIVFSGYEKIVRAAHKDSLIVMDAYHGFMAMPTNLSSVENKLFYISGGYKYAQSGEGVCFMYSPPGLKLRPVNTGWFADMKSLSQDQKSLISYSNDGYRFAGSTMDYTALYRLNATLSLLKRDAVSVDRIHAYVQDLQKDFLEKLNALEHPLLNLNSLLSADPNAKKDLKSHSHFLAFELPDASTTEKLVANLQKNKILTDSRKNVIRFGFGMYQNKNYTLNLSVI
jgi:selenocysteine lyase/cysteine desulfurase